jgi:hypothetical protein
VRLANAESRYNRDIGIPFAAPGSWLDLAWLTVEAGVEKNMSNKKPLDQQLRDYPFIQLLVMSGMLALCITGATHSKAHAAQLVISAPLFVLRRLYYQIGILRCDS